MKLLAEFGSQLLNCTHSALAVAANVILAVALSYRLLSQRTGFQKYVYLTLAKTRAYGNLNCRLQDRVHDTNHHTGDAIHSGRPFTHIFVHPLMQVNQAS